MAVQSRRGMRQHMAHYIRENLKDGDDLVDFYLDVFKGNVKGLGQKANAKLKADVPLRMSAGFWLGDRAWGKPEQHIELDVGANLADGDLRAISTEALEALLRQMDETDGPKALQKPIEVEYSVTPFPVESFSA